MKRPTTLWGLMLCSLAACAGAGAGGGPAVDSHEPTGRALGPLSMPNGPGLGANGPGLGANGPGIGQPYDSFGAKQEAIGLAYLGFAGAKFEGAPLRSIGLVKGELRATLANGARLHGAEFAGVELRARGLKRDGTLADGSAAAGGPALPKDRVVLVATASPPDPQAPLQDGDFYHYAIRVKDPTSGAFVDPCEGGYAIALPGRWDHRRGVLPAPERGDPGGGSYDPDDSVFSFACQGTSVQKCAEAAHYKPWQAVLGPLKAGCDPVETGGPCEREWTLAGADALRACVRLVRGDFCGDGTPLTFDGTVIDGNDNFPDAGIEPDVPDHPAWHVEAGWGPDGASCADQFRVTGAINAHMTGTCKQRLTGTDGGCDMNATVLGPFASRRAPVLLNRGQRKLSVYLPAEPYAGNHYGASAAVYVDAPRRQHLLAIGAPRSNDDAGLVHLFRVSTDPADLGARAFLAMFKAPASVRPNELFGKTIAFRAGPAGPDLLISVVQGDAHAPSPGAVWPYPFAGWDGAKPTFGEPTLLASPAPAGSYFGDAMASTPDGRLFISAPFAPCPGGNIEAGAVFVVEPGGRDLTPLPQPQCPAGWGHFGFMLRALDDGSVLVSSGHEVSANAACALTGWTMGVVRRYAPRPDGTFAPTWKIDHPQCPDYADGYSSRFAATARVGDALVVGAANVRAQGVDGWGKLYVYDYAGGAAPTLRGVIDPPAAAAPGEFGHALAGYTAGGADRLAVPHHRGDGLYFFKRVGATFELEGRLKDPFGTTGKSMGSPIVAAPPFLYFSSHEATDSNLSSAGYFFHFNFDDAEPTPLPSP
jgi:hypothetical protein